MFSSWSEFLPMVNFAINNSVHASNQHTSFFVNGLRHPRLPTLLECDFYIVGNRSCKTSSGSCSSRVDAKVITYDADVHQVDIEEEDPFNNSDGSIIESDDDTDAGIFSITNDYSSDDNDTLADEKKEKRSLSAVRTSQTEQNNT